MDSCVHVVRPCTCEAGAHCNLERSGWNVMWYTAGEKRTSSLAASSSCSTAESNMTSNRINPHSKKLYCVYATIAVCKLRVVTSLSLRLTSRDPMDLVLDEEVDHRGHGNKETTVRSALRHTRARRTSAYIVAMNRLRDADPP